MGGFSTGFFNKIASQSLRKGKSPALEKTKCVCQCRDNIRRKLNPSQERGATIENLPACK